MVRKWIGHRPSAIGRRPASKPWRIARPAAQPMAPHPLPLCPFSVTGFRGHLSQRQIFREAFGREAFHRAAQHGEERSAGWMRAPQPSVEIRRNGRAIERVLQHAHVLLRRPDEDRHLVEPHAARGLFQQPPRDLNALPSLSRRGKPHSSPVWSRSGGAALENR